MNEPTKTLAFVASAAIIVGLAITTHFVNRPKSGGEFELVGKPFFEDFTSSEAAKSLEVTALDPKTLALKTFSVENKDGLWSIPSHHNYPAEAADRLAMTATSVMGIERESLAGRLASEHEKLGVVDPLDDSLDGSDPEATGKRITIKDSDGEPIVDLIIGKEAGEVDVDAAQESINASAPKKYYYVRRVDEQATYKSRIEIDLSTKFSDWIDPDLLRLDAKNLVRLNIDNYSLVKGKPNPLSQLVTMVKSQGDQLLLTRKSGTDPWQLDSLKPESEQLNLPRVDEIVNVLDELKIAGVRPKYKYKGQQLLNPDLSINQRPEFFENTQETQRALSRLIVELEDKGFSIGGTNEKPELTSYHGQLQIGTSEGVLYSLLVGNAVKGEDESIEIGEPTENEKLDDDKSEDGKSKKPDESATKVSDSAQTKDTENPEDKNAAADEQDLASESTNRYLMITASFSEDLLSNTPVKPTEPVKPVAPAGYQPAVKSDPVESSQSTEPGEASPKIENESDSADDRDPAFIQYENDLAAYEEAKIEYELALTRYEADKKTFKEKVVAGEKLVAELNERFADWYYVVTAENLKTLQTQRSELVSPIAPADGNEAAIDPRLQELFKEQPLPSQPDISFPEIEGTDE